MTSPLSTGRSAPDRSAQRRRTRRAIVDATARLLAEGAESPSISEIAAAADVARRTVYLHFPSLDQLLLDAIAGSLGAAVDDVVAAMASDDARVRLVALIDALTATMADTLTLGRRLIKITVDRPRDTREPLRGYRRIGWIESAVEPLRADLGPERFERLVSAIATVVGWEAFIVLADVRGLDIEASGAIVREAALAMLDAACR